MTFKRGLPFCFRFILKSRYWQCHTEYININMARTTSNYTFHSLLCVQIFFSFVRVVLKDNAFTKHHKSIQSLEYSFYKTHTNSGGRIEFHQWNVWGSYRDEFARNIHIFFLFSNLKFLTGCFERFETKFRLYICHNSERLQVCLNTYDLSGLCEAQKIVQHHVKYTKNKYFHIWFQYEISLNEIQRGVGVFPIDLNISICTLQLCKGTVISFKIEKFTTLRRDHFKIRTELNRECFMLQQSYI